MLEIRKHSEYNLVPPTPPCIDCRKKRLDGECYQWCDKWYEYADKYQGFVKTRDEVKRSRCHEQEGDIG